MPPVGNVLHSLIFVQSVQSIHKGQLPHRCCREAVRHFTPSAPLMDAPAVVVPITPVGPDSGRRSPPATGGKADRSARLVSRPGNLVRGSTTGLIHRDRRRWPGASRVRENYGRSNHRASMPERGRRKTVRSSVHYVGADNVSRSKCR